MITLNVILGLISISGWTTDFEKQPLEQRPMLEVRYADATRSAFDILADSYQLRGELRKPHRLLKLESGREWLSFEMEDWQGYNYSTRNTGSDSRINLYRRGPYFCEIHWLDLKLSDDSGRAAPLKGDLALYCYPDKILASITWFALDDFKVGRMRAKGLLVHPLEVKPFLKNERQTFAFPLFGETEPLPASAFENLDVESPVHYDSVRGCYVVGSLSTGGFQGHFYDHPNRYETARFSVTNDDQERCITVCHENVGGDRGSVEGGILLDEEGHPLPLVVQISKNFAGEKEEPFYNPDDTPFSETYFPLYLKPGEKRTLTSLHLYQNWGRHRVKQFSSLGAWMDYFHSSTGVTENTCYVPFKFGGLPGVDIADFRAMSQPAYWSGQPQHDNVAGHSFLSYRSEGSWQYLEYRGTTYHSTGPNWMDIGFQQRSSDGKIAAEIRTFEIPQTDELRNFIHVRYRVLEPVRIEKPQEDFRLLRITTRIQALRYTHFFSSGGPDVSLDLSQEGFAVTGRPLPAEDAYVGLYGDPKGSNGILIHRGSGTVSGQTVGLSASVWIGKKGDCELYVVPAAEALDLQPGDGFEIEGYWMPYGTFDSAEPMRQEAALYGADRPRIPEIKVGTKVSDWPPEIRASGNSAELTLQGGKNLLPLIISGLNDYRWPRLYRMESSGWKPVGLSRVGSLDGAQVFSQGNGLFGAVFLVPSDGAPQRLKAESGKPEPASDRITVKAFQNPDQGVQHVALIQAPWMEAPIQLRYPETVMTDTLDFIDHHREDMPPRVDSSPFAKSWQETEAGSIAFEWTYDNQKVGGRLTPNEEDVDLEFWMENRRTAEVQLTLQFCAVMNGTLFEDRTLERTWIHTEGSWKRMKDTNRGKGKFELCHYAIAGGPDVKDAGDWGGSPERADVGVAAITSEDGKRICAVAWPHARSILSNAFLPCIHADPMNVACPPDKRVHLEGKLYLMEGSLDDLLARVKRDVGGG